MTRKSDPFAVAKELAALELEDDIEVFGPKVLAIMKGVSSGAWTMLDEKPGRFSKAYNERFYMLRRVRNDTEWGARMFAGFVR